MIDPFSMESVAKAAGLTPKPNMTDFKKIESDAIERCKEILNNMDPDSAGDLAMNVLGDKEALDDFIKKLFAFFFMAKIQKRPDEATKFTHIASYLSIQGFLFEEFNRQEEINNRTAGI